MSNVWIDYYFVTLWPAFTHSFLWLSGMSSYPDVGIQYLISGNKASTLYYQYYWKIYLIGFQLFNSYNGPVTRAYFSTYNSTYGYFFKQVKIVIYKFCTRSKYAGIRFETFSYGDGARVLSAQNFPTYESIWLTRFTHGGHTCGVSCMTVDIRLHTLQIMQCVCKTYV